MIGLGLNILNTSLGSVSFLGPLLAQISWTNQSILNTLSASLTNLIKFLFEYYVRKFTNVGQDFVTINKRVGGRGNQSWSDRERAHFV